MKIVKTKGKNITFGPRSLIMGILNVTPDSFSDGGNYNNLAAAKKHAEEMLADGADIIDIGGESTRPGHSLISADEEKKRIVPVVELVSKLGAIISIDTTKPEVAEEALLAGAHIINDIWGFQQDEAMAKIAAEHQAMSVLMHNRTAVDAAMDIVEDCKRFFAKSIEIALKAGLAEELIVLDVGIGFGKTPLQNIELLKRLAEFKEFGMPLLLGTSRKSTLGLILNLPVDQREEATVATTVLGIAKGADIFRVHDVKANVRAAKVSDAVERNWREWIK